VSTPELDEIFETGRRDGLAGRPIPTEYVVGVWGARCESQHEAAAYLAGWDTGMHQRPTGGAE
jgi:hypothetical protein